MSNLIDNMRLERALAEISGGKPSAIGTVYDICGRHIIALADSILRDISYAEDVLQETVMKILNGSAKYRSGGSARAWVLTIARNTALDMKKKRSQTVDIEDFYNTDADGFSVDDSDIDNKLMLEDALSGLDEVTRQIVVLKAVAGLRHAQIGKMLGLSADAVRKRYCRALERLSATVKPENY